MQVFVAVLIQRYIIVGPHVTEDSQTVDNFGN